MRAAALLLLLGLVACGDGSDHGYAATAAGARQEPYVAIPPGSIPRGTGARRAALAPPGPPVPPRLLAEGRLGYAGLCAPCHGADGGGDGPVVRKGFPRPPAFAGAALPPAEVVAVITDGKGAMPSLAGVVPPGERWAIAHYVQHLAGGGADK